MLSILNNLKIIASADFYWQSIMEIKFKSVFINILKRLMIVQSKLKTKHF